MAFELERPDGTGTVTIDQGRKPTLVGVFLGTALDDLGLLVHLTEPGVGDDGAAGGELHIAAIVGAGTELQRDGLAGAIGHLGGDGTLPDELVGTRFGLRHFFGDVGREPERVARRTDGLVSFLRVLRLGCVVAGSVGKKLLAITLRDHRAGSLQRGVRQRRAVGAHVGDVALLVETLRRPHRHLRTHPELATRLLLVGRGDERRRRPAPVGLGFARTHLVGHAVERADQRLGTGFVEHSDIGSSEASVIAEITAAGETDPIDRVQGRGELPLVVALGCCERPLDIPVVGGDERHALSFSFDHESSTDALHPAGRELRHDFLPQHRADLVTVKPVEDAASLLGIHHLAVELAR